MDINQLFSDLLILAGILLMTVLAVGPLWLTHDSRAPRCGHTQVRAGRRSPGAGVTIRT